MSISKKARFFISKRISPYPKIKWELNAEIKGSRKLRHALKYGKPINLWGKSHLHIYPVLECNLQCYFCQNRFYVDKEPKIKFKPAKQWLKYLNRMYNVHHLDINGGEPMLYPEIVELLNGLRNWNIVIFTNMPRNRIHTFQEIYPNNNNIMFCVSYHVLEEEKRGRDIAEFVKDFKTIPKRLNPTAHIIDIPEISYKNIRTAFAKRGIFIQASDAITPTEHNKITDNFRVVKCKSDMDTIAPDLKVYPCLAFMLRQINGKYISDYKFTNEHIFCGFYGLCGPCSTQKDIIRL